MIPTKFQYIWLSDFRREDYNLKSERTTYDRLQVMEK